MNGLRLLKGAAVSVACWGLLLPNPSMLAAGPQQNAGAASAQVNRGQAPRMALPAGHQSKSSRGPVIRAQAPAIVDVALSAGGSVNGLGTVTGLVVDSNNTALPGMPVSILQNNQEVVKTVTDGNGNFAIANLRGGVYQITAGSTGGLFRFWAPNTAAPGTRGDVVLVSGIQQVQNEEEFFVDDDPGILGVDAVTLTLLAVAIAGLTIAIIELADDDDTIIVPVSP